MRIVTGEEMRKLDRITIEKVGIPGVVLMEQAGCGAAQEISSRIGASDSVLIIAGKGNNGGDGFVIHRWLSHWGYNCTTLLLTSREQISGDARINLEILYHLNEDVREVKNEAELQEFWNGIGKYDLIVDAILGTGLKGEVRGLSRRVIEMINESELPVMAVDIPSGLDSVRGVPLGVAVEADFTVTFGLPKLGLLLYPGKYYTGDLVVQDIGIPDRVVKEAGIYRFLMDDELCRKMLPLRSEEGHKGTFGRVLVLAGSVGMTGAAALTGEAALRSGAGLVTLGIPKSLNPIMEVKLTEVMTYPLPEENGRLSREGIPEIQELMKKVDVVAVGPGLGQSEDLVKILEVILKECDKPLVIDADGLNNLKSLLHLLKERQKMTVLTPHPGEMARLTGLKLSEIQTDRVGVAERFAREYGVVLVLKGVSTITAFPDGQIYLNSTGNEGMGTGGSGDVLTGILSGFLAQQKDEISIPAGVYVHGLAGDIAADRGNSRSLIAGDLLRGLALAFQKLEVKR
ncbi:bifunctional ADP-dependent (S)-NAD(P)H-hydrate dehydratase/NAD(P)H-hydrate epimerase [Anoxybacter fermentans]|uniref:Bifunctional NAD(P)H-hydrate repair enzyme n=1 Tax=Anoxybacter fermentans TaxID=1323375 RepID=A0A3Q9HNJ0_9FIRM|nr:NAD(P)H-hydrate dehydratase [Anoxybacter fermentans]AZR71976.1 bifunctional ADP-dependent (S)-NAD(P)H-hydrate dehydratase/NAD(P)H-hydrate epimerase [Anoxybacter fermentans]